MAEFFLRPATEADFPEIKALIRQVRINPTGLDWRRFTVAVNVPGVPPLLVPDPASRDLSRDPAHAERGTGRDRGTARPRRIAGRTVSEAEGSGQMIGCGQLKPVPGGLTELASLAVRPAYRHQGIARALIEHLLADAPRPVYLTCRSSLGKLYEKFGFRALEADETPPYYRRLQRLAGVFMDLTHQNETLFVMKLG